MKKCVQKKNKMKILKDIINLFLKQILKQTNNHENNEFVPSDNEIPPQWFHFVDIQRVTSPYGKRKNPLNPSKEQFHNGTDYTGNNLYAKAPCKCVVEKIVHHDSSFPYKYKWVSNQFIQTNVPKGHAWTPYTVLRAFHDSNLKFIYRHGECNKEIGSVVEGNDSFYTIGNYGNSKGAHLHIEVLINEKEVDPDKFIQSKIKGE